jgi:hypothetical protein
MGLKPPTPAMVGLSTIRTTMRGQLTPGLTSISSEGLASSLKTEFCRVRSKWMAGYLSAVWSFLIHAPVTLGTLVSSVSGVGRWGGTVLYAAGYTVGCAIWLSPIGYLLGLPYVSYLSDKDLTKRRLVRRVFDSTITIFSLLLAGIFSLVITGLLIAAVLDVLLWLINVFSSASYHIWYIPGALIVMLAFYALRCFFLPAYAVLESFTGLGMIIIYSGILPLKSQPDPLLRLVAMLGGVYVIVRGFDNFDKSVTDLRAILPADMYLFVRVNWERWITLRMWTKPGKLDEILKDEDATLTTAWRDRLRRDLTKQKERLNNEREKRNG